MKSKKLHLIIDGTDKIGKTTVIELLSKNLRIPVIKMKDMSVHFKDNPEEMSEVFNKTVAQFKDFSFILDRGYPSSIVYNEFFERKYDLSYLVNIVEELEPEVVILMGTPRAPDELISSYQQKEIEKIYKKKAIQWQWNIINVDKLTPEEICSKIENLL